MGALLLLLNILKIIGIIILAILLVLLLIICVLLFVPFKYYISAEKFEEIKAYGRVKWLFGLLSVEVEYIGGETKVKIKFLGIDTEKRRKQSEEKRRKKAAEKHRKKKQELRAQSKDVSKSEKTSEEKIPKVRQTVASEKTVVKESVEEKQTASCEIKKSEKAAVRRIKMSEIKFEEDKQHVIIEKEDIKEAENEKNFEKEEKKNNTQTVDLDYFKNMPLDEKKALIKAAFKFIKKVLKGVLPQNIKVKAIVGTGDPENTGYVLAVAAMLNGIISPEIDVKGDFAKASIEGRAEILGSIRIAVFLQAALGLILTKPVRRIVKTYLKGRGE